MAGNHVRPGARGLPGAKRAVRYQVKRCGSGYAVFDEFNTRLTGTLCFNDAEARLDTLRRQERDRLRVKSIACLCCGKTFESQGIHNRMCEYCRKKTEGLI